MANKMPIPPNKAKEDFPSYRYCPKTGESRVFEEKDIADCPKGWTRDPYKYLNAESRPDGKAMAAEKPARKAPAKGKGKKDDPKKDEPELNENPNDGLAKELGVSRDELLDVLNEAGVEFDAEASEDDLAALYKAELEKEA